MISGASYEARWLCSEPRRTSDAPVFDQILHRAFGPHRILAVQPLIDGLRNANFKIQLDTDDWVVVRIYEHDASLCQKEMDLLQLVRGSVPVPEVIYAEPRGLDDIPPFAVIRFVEGISFRALKRRGDKEAIAQAASSAGETLAAIGRFTFSKSGWLAPGPAVTTPLLEGADPKPRFVDLCLASTNLRQRIPEELCDRIHTLVWSWAPQFAALDNQSCLVHGDFGKRNLLMQCNGGQWSVAAVLDWEFAFSGSPLGDLGHFLRYERGHRALAEPYFSEGYLHAGGLLPDDWRRLARLIDMIALCNSLTYEQLPNNICMEILELIRAAVEDRDPSLP